jgi:bifunctional non-homologous end joining protein LigD
MLRTAVTVTMERFHRGIGEAGFFQKSVAKGAPDWLEHVDVPKKGGTVRHPLINDKRSLLWLANQNCITPHVWASRVPRLQHPDICVFDLDPLQDDAESLRRAALGLRDLLSELGLTSWVKTTGSKGFHIAVPMDGKSDAGAVSDFAHGVGRLLVARYPRELTLEFSKADRGGRIYVDTGRNHPPATFAATYAVQAGPQRPSRHRVPGPSWKLVLSARRPSPCARWRSALPTSATCGRIFTGDPTRFASR